jgi:hypothetical protein
MRLPHGEEEADLKKKVVLPKYHILPLAAYLDILSFGWVVAQPCLVRLTDTQLVRQVDVSV